ncbi:hypothetical protein INT45_002187 [Circinella minor]|uniref:Uncharacterized protein n=1 Tax=Circinella minor TaxID=1195481 RepID=A0A8H7S224_9FUNG|nr:hypothetical protein INT45_002187 [Circinella minor]
MSTVEEEESHSKPPIFSYLHQKEKSGKGKSSLTRSVIIKSNLYKDLDRLEESLDADFEKHLAEVRAASLKHGNLNLTNYNNDNTKRSTTLSVSKQQQYYDNDDSYYNNDNDNSEETESILGGLEHVPFVGDILPPFGSRPSSVRGLSDVSIHSDKEILGELLLTQSLHGKENRYINDQERSRRKGRQEKLNDSRSRLDDESNSLGRQQRTSNHQWIPNRDLVDEKYSVTPLVNPVITTTASKTTPLTTHYKKNKEVSSAEDTSLSHHHPPRTMSPGRYFAARSLPLDSFDEIWNNNNNSNNNNKKGRSSIRLSSTMSSRKNSASLDSDDLLLQSFKLLPQALSHNYNIQPVNNNSSSNTSRRTTSNKYRNDKKSTNQHSHKHLSSSLLDRSFNDSIKSNRSQQHYDNNNEYVSIPVIRQEDHKSSDRTKRNTGVVSGTVRLRRIHAVDRSNNTTDIEDYDQYSDEQEDCIVEPERLLLQCKIDVNNVRPGNSKLRITNNLTHRSRTFSLFSARAKLKFLNRQGVVPAGGHIDIIVRSKRSAATNGKHSQQVNVDMEIIDERRKQIKEEEEDDSLLLSQSLVSDIQPTLSTIARHHRHPSINGIIQQEAEEQILPPPPKPAPTPTAITTNQPIKSKCPICVMEQECC